MASHRSVGLLFLAFFVLSGCVQYGEDEDGQYLVPPECRETNERSMMDIRSRQEVMKWLSMQGVRITQVGQSTELLIPVDRLFLHKGSINRKKSDGQLIGQEMMGWIAKWINSYKVEKIEVQGREYVQHASVYQEGLLRQQATQIQKALVRHRVDAGIISSSARMITEDEQAYHAQDVDQVIRIYFRYLPQSD